MNRLKASGGALSCITGIVVGMLLAGVVVPLAFDDADGGSTIDAFAATEESTPATAIAGGAE